jgi:hypothetical protein
VGVIYGGLPSTIYGFFLGYLNVEGYVYATAATIVSLPWSFKFLFGAVNDCVPLFGYRRKPYMVIGWAVCALALLRLATMPLPKPYWCVDADGAGYVRTVKTASGGTAAATPCNRSASEAGGRYAFLMMVASLGYCVADVAADGLTVSLARAEPPELRGQQCPGNPFNSLQYDFVRVDANDFCVQISRTRAEMINGLRRSRIGPKLTEIRASKVKKTRGFLDTGGQTQTSVYLVRTLGNVVAVAVVGLFMNSWQYNGSFTWGLSYPTIMGLFAVPATAMVPVSWLSVKEQRAVFVDDVDLKRDEAGDLPPLPEGQVYERRRSFRQSARAASPVSPVSERARPS